MAARSRRRARAGRGPPFPATPWASSTRRGGYRRGRGESEASRQRPPAAGWGGVAGDPAPTRTEVVRAVVVLKRGYEGTPAMKPELKEFVRTRLAAHEYPRIVEFRSELPLT